MPSPAPGSPMRRHHTMTPLVVERGSRLLRQTYRDQASPWTHWASGVASARLFLLVNNYWFSYLLGALTRSGTVPSNLGRERPPHLGQQAAVG